MAYLHGKFVWFQHISDAVPKARDFYRQLFDWRIESVSMGQEQYDMIHAGPQAIGGFRAAQPGTPNHWLPYLSVPDVDAAVPAALAAGGRVLMPASDFPPVGRGAVVADPLGAVVAPWKSAEGDQPDTETIRVGAWYWNECVAPDEQRALQFYESVFGFAHETMTMPKGTYYVLMKDGKARAGLMRAPMPGGPGVWCPYVSVADCDSIATRAVKLGANLCVPPMDIPDVGRLAVLFDPFGAMIGVIKGKFTAG